MARRYDSRTTIFSPEGRLYQVEYAMEAISNAGAAMGILAKDGVVLAAEKKILSKVPLHHKLCAAVENSMLVVERAISYSLSDRKERAAVLLSSVAASISTDSCTLTDRMAPSFYFRLGPDRPHLMQTLRF